MDSQFARDLAARLRDTPSHEWEAVIDDALIPVRKQVGTVVLGTSGSIRSHPPIDRAAERELQKRITIGLREPA